MAREIPNGPAPARLGDNPIIELADGTKVGAKHFELAVYRLTAASRARPFQFRQPPKKQGGEPTVITADWKAVLSELRRLAHDPKASCAQTLVDYMSAQALVIAGNGKLTCGIREVVLASDKIARRNQGDLLLDRKRLIARS